LESTGDAPSFVPDDMWIRLLCHVLIERLPAEALSGVWENVHDAWEWHTHTRPRLPAPSEHQIAGPGVDRVFTVVEEPPFRISED